jgi:hypothetical protein
MAYDANQVPFENVGLRPQILIPSGAASVDNALRRDYVLEQAIAWLKGIRLTPGTVPGGNGQLLSWQGELGGRYTLLRVTNLLSGGWEVGPGWTSNRAGLGELMWYTNPFPAPLEFYRLQVGF